MKRVINLLKPLININMKEYSKVILNIFLILIFLALIVILRINPRPEIIFIIFLITLFVYLFKFYNTKFIIKNFHFVQFCTLFILFFILSYKLIFVIINNPQNYQNGSYFIYYIPVVCVVMFTNILFNDFHLGFVMALAVSLTTGFLINADASTLFIFVITSVLSNVLVLGVRQRSEITKAAFLCGVIQQLLCIFFLDEFRPGIDILDKWYYYFVPLISGFLSGAVVVGVLPVLEGLFKIVTNISLLELADYKRPLLQRMSLEAPGTYHHSLIVSNLSEAAADAIGANSLLVRVGAYYHDIGKIEKAEYFSENQIPTLSKHDTLTPTISKLLITNHVREGIEIGKRYKLNSRIIDFISQHHGTSLVYYFYVRALESKKRDEELEEEQFRYPGPKPQTREAAIVLLADSVEAASRTLEEPTPLKIEDLTHKIINNKFIDGQLDECDLTLRDLEAISRVFSRILVGIYHARIKYPEKKSDVDIKESTDNQEDKTPI